MNYKKFLGAASAALLIVFIVTLMLTPGAWAAGKYKTLYKFKGSKDGGAPAAGLIFDAGGNLYGTTVGGGTFSQGTIFELTPKAGGVWKERVLYSFTGGADGGSPYAGLIFDQAGNLYGTTLSGGSPCFNTVTCGVVFEVTPNRDGSWSESVLHTFGWWDGMFPYAGLIFDKVGNLYGTTRFGSDCCGVVFELTPNPDGSWTESVLHSFAGGDNGDGVYPDAGLIFDRAGNLYGTTGYIDGSFFPGVAFELTPNSGGSWTESILYSFCSLSNCGDGAAPYAGMIFDEVGNLYGTTAIWGAYYPGGGVFELSPNADGSWTESVLHSFCSLTNCRDGSTPYAGLISDAAGNFYGTASSGGAYGYGVVFKLTRGPHGQWKEHVLHAFVDRPGANPLGGLIFDAAGNLYGTTGGDGTMTFGSVFEITP